MILTILGFFALFINGSLCTGSNMDPKLFDFTQKSSSVDGWREVSDTVREVGMSKATLTMQKTQVFNRAIFFALLNPQPNGACFAGMVYDEKYNLSNFNSLVINCRAQGNTKNYKIIMCHKGKNSEPYPTYEHFFNAPNENEFQTIKLAFKDVQAYYRGKLVPDAEPLYPSDITRIGIQVYGGVYEEQKYAGITSLEINFIKVE